MNIFYYWHFFLISNSQLSDITLSKSYAQLCSVWYPFHIWWHAKIFNSQFWSFQITGYGENGTGDANDVWRVELIGGTEGDTVKTVTSKVKFHHYFMKCVLSCSGKLLPKWGFEQQEISCNPTTRDPNALWNVEDNFFPKCNFPFL